MLDMDSQSHCSQLAYATELQTCYDTGLVNITDSCIYAAKRRGSNPDNPTLQQAVHGPNSEEYVNAMKLEILTLISQKTWSSVPCSAKMNILKGTLAFKLKRLPDGSAHCFKAHFCACGDLQREGVDFFEIGRAHV